MKGETRNDYKAGKHEYQEDTGPEIIVLWLRDLELLVEGTLFVSIVSLGGHVAVAIASAILGRTLLVRLLLVWLLRRRLIRGSRRLRLVLLLITAVILLLLTPVVISVGFAHDGDDSMELSTGNWVFNSASRLGLRDQHRGVVEYVNTKAEAN